ncbi:hypothetical protein Hanom_Chr09g00861241 [Helianthus anomalus]
MWPERKKDKGRKNFGFVSCREVRDRKDPERILSNARMGRYKLKVNIARFTLDNSDGNNNQREQMKVVEDYKMIQGLGIKLQHVEDVENPLGMF